MAAEAGDPTELQAHRLALWRGLDGGDERRLAKGSASSLAAGAFATEVGIVQFDTSSQTLAGIALHHDLLQLVLDLPGRGLRHPETTAQLDAGDALLALGQ